MCGGSAKSQKMCYTVKFLTTLICWKRGETTINLSRNVRKRTFEYVRPAKIQIRLRFRAVWSESSLDAFWIDKDAKFLYADIKDSDQTAWLRRLIWVFVQRSCNKVCFLTLRFNLILKDGDGIYPRDSHELAYFSWFFFFFFFYLTCWKMNKIK